MAGKQRRGREQGGGRKKRQVKRNKGCSFCQTLVKYTRHINSAKLGTMVKIRAVLSYKDLMSSFRFGHASDSLGRIFPGWLGHSLSSL